MPSERAFIDYFANHPSTEAEFPATKPDDAGREKTMYIVLEKVDTNLDHFLRTEAAEALRNIFTRNFWTNFVRAYFHTKVPFLFNQ